MYAFKEELAGELAAIREAGTWKEEREIVSAQGAEVETTTGAALNFCANNCLGLADDSRVRDAAHEALDQWGFGLSSVRFICGTQTPHRELERELADWLGTDDAILFSSCFDANGAIFDVLLWAEDAIVSDELNHASIIDGVRLGKAARYRYRNGDVADLRSRLKEARAAGARRIMIATDGVFSMDGSYAPLPEIVEAAEKYGALVMVDDSHAVGFIGVTGAGTPEMFGVKVDVLTGTLGKALGGASGGYVAGPQEVIDLLRQHGRPYLFSNTVAPAVVGGSLQAIRIARYADESRAHLARNAELFRSLMEEAGFTLLPGSHPIVPVMFASEREAVEIADRMLAEGVYVIAFSYPVVPKGRARIRVQLSAAHTEEDVRECVDAFVRARQAVVG